jgi:uncharacterized protein (TIGR04255 family)
MNVGKRQSRLTRAPIVEAVLDIDCDIPAAKDLAALERDAQSFFGRAYPKFRTRYLQEHEIRHQEGTPTEMVVRRGLHALQFLLEDEKQLVQVRPQGYSFNRLAPYSTLDDYLPEIERTWRQFVELAAPAQVRQIRLRYINRILLPLSAGTVNLKHYLKFSPRIPDEDRFTLSDFLNQHSATEIESGNVVNTVLTCQAQESEFLPVIFDIEVASKASGVTTDWAWMLAKILELRALKNRVFRNTLTKRCISLFR